MAKKVTITVLSVLVVLGTVAGVYFYNVDKDLSATPSQETVAVTQSQEDEQEYYEDYLSQTDALVDDNTEDSTQFAPSDEQLSDNTEDIVTTEFSIEQVVDHTTDEIVQPRVVFGSGFNKYENYIRFSTDGAFEIYFTGFSADVIYGTYTEYDDVIYVEYDDGTAAEYDIIRNDSSIISHIAVNYGDYDIYFS